MAIPFISPIIQENILAAYKRELEDVNKKIAAQGNNPELLEQQEKVQKLIEQQRLSMQFCSTENQTK